MKLYHTSPDKIEKISKNGMFDDCLFFANDPYFMTQASNPVVYSIEIDESKIIDVYDLDERSVIENIMEVVEVDEDDAERLLDGRDTAFDHGKDGETDWWVQAKQGEAARMMGFEACRARDEQGTVYIVPMFGREKELIIVD